MVFSSATFLLFFFPIFLIGYFAMRSRFGKNVFLLIASLFFYAWGEPVYIVLMLASIGANYLLAIGAQPDARYRKSTLIIAILFNIAVIGFFKYEGFIADNINTLVGTSAVPNLQLPLPIGISFYTLQALSYVIDVYRGEVGPQRNILYLGMYIACFPQLIAGPIVRYQTIQEQVLERKETLTDFASGLRLFIVGLSKKVLLANTCAILAADMLAKGGATIGAIGAWGGLVAYTFQIFFDFSGYSDMAIGLGRMMGFRYLRNFNYPYISKSVTEFWRRWHMSLSTFFRDYIYIPLGGSRVSPARNILNIAIVWAITGLWHGAAWNYILWGVYYGVLLIAEKYLWGSLLRKLPSTLQHLYCIIVFVCGWSFFWITDPSQLSIYWQALIGGYGAKGTSMFWELGVWEYWPVFAICLLASTPLIPWVKERFLAWAEDRSCESVVGAGIANARQHDASPLCTYEAAPASRKRDIAFRAARIALDVILILLLVACISSVVAGSFNPFIYFQF